MLDLNLIPLNFVDGIEQAELPGFYGATCPRRAARGRAQEQVVLFLTLLGSTPFSPTSIRQLLERLTQEYFQTPGSVTAALHSMIEAMNTQLMERNLRNAKVGRQAMGNLNLAVFHGDHLYLAQSGAAHAFLIGPQPMQHFSDPQIATRGLGLTSTPAIRYYQADLAGGQYLALCANPPATWTAATLGGAPAASLETIRRRLLSQAPANLAAALVQIAPGSGKTNLVAPAGRPAAPSMVREGPRSRPPVAAPVTPTATPAEKDAAPTLLPLKMDTTPAPSPAVPTAAETPAAAAVEPPAPASVPPKPVQPPLAQPQTTPTTAAPSAEPPAARVQSRYTYSRSGRSQPGRVIRPATGPEGEPVIQEVQRRRRTSTFLRSVGAFLSSARAFRQRAGHAISAFIARLMPGASESLPPLSNSTMIFIAIAVPVIVVTAALVVYNEKGRGDYYRLYYAQAQLSASQAASLKDDSLQNEDTIRSAWNDTLAQLDKAEGYQKTTDSQALRQQAWAALDKLNGLERLDFKPVTSTDLGQNVHISRIVATGNELFMLDSNQGRLVYGIQTGHGYDIDPTFTCLPGSPTAQSPTNRLVDITALPVGNAFKASLAAVDEAGDFIYCLPGEAPTSFPLAAPDAGWGQIAAITIDTRILYVLAPKTNQIYYYDPDDSKGEYRGAPNKLFDNPPALGDAIDLAVNGNRVYILHRDGHLTDCTVYDSATAPTHCTSPAVFNDFRPNRPSNPTSFPDTELTHILYSPPPEPSIYLLDANAATIYLFSMQLNLQSLFSASIEVISSQNDPKATAFTINKSNRNAFIAWGNQVYYAYMP
jgi:hypothetical protein